MLQRGVAMLQLSVVLYWCSLTFAAGLPSTSPHAYDGMPSGDYSTEWQKYFQVTDKLPGVDFKLGNSYAGNIAVQRPNHPNDTLFFWAFEQSAGSLTASVAENSNQPWAVWLQGGPGSSSMTGLMTENGPIHLETGTQTLSQEKYPWNALIDYFWVDQPVGVGFSTADSNGYASDENQVATDFVGFLDNLVKVFPSMATRPFYLTGESYAGRYIPYIAKALFSMSNPPVKLAKIMVGDPAFGSNQEFKIMPTLTLLETYPQIIGYDTDVYDYFKEQSHLCGFDINLTYPQTGGHFPTINVTAGAVQDPDRNRDDEKDKERTKSRKSKRMTKSEFVEAVASRFEELGASLAPREGRLAKRALWKRDLSNSSIIDPWYGCDVWDEMIDYALNYTFPWSKAEDFDVFDVPDALNPETSDDPGFFFNDPKVVNALHAPTNGQWYSSIDYPWGSEANAADPSPEPMTFFNELATNASNNGVQILMYVGNDDAISPHFGTEVTIQNTTFGGIQGFTRQPSTPWWDLNGEWAGIVHQERNWTYALIYGAGHEVPADRHVAAYTFVQQFLVGNNQTGLVESSGNTTTVVGGENPTLQQAVIPGAAAIYYGASTTQGSTTWPSATIARFESHVGQVAVTGTGAIKPAKTNAAMAAVRPVHGGFVVFAVVLAKLLAAIM